MSKSTNSQKSAAANSKSKSITPKSAAVAQSVIPQKSSAVKKLVAQQKSIASKSSTANKKPTASKKPIVAKKRVVPKPLESAYSRDNTKESHKAAAIEPVKSLLSAQPRDLTKPLNSGSLPVSTATPRFRAEASEDNKRRKRRRVLIILLRILAVLIIVTCAVGIFAIFWPEYSSDQARNQLEQEYTTESGRVDIVQLQAEYPEAVAWIKLPDTNISYPVAYSGNNEKYLYTDLGGNYSSFGTVFLDKSNKADLSDAHNVVYGHNMFSRTMFSQLTMFLRHDFLNNYHTGTVYTATETLTIKPIALVKIHMSEGKLLVRNFTRQSVADTFMEGMQAKIITNLDGYDYKASPSARYWSLITCSSPDDENRLVLLTEVISSEPV